MNPWLPSYLFGYGIGHLAKACIKSFSLSVLISFIKCNGLALFEKYIRTSKT